MSMSRILGCRVDSFAIGRRKANSSSHGPRGAFRETQAILCLAASLLSSRSVASSKRGQSSKV